MKDKFKKAVDKILKKGTATQWIFTGKEDEDKKTLAEDIANACNTLHNQAMKEERKNWIARLKTIHFAATMEASMNKFTYDSFLKIFTQIAKENNIEL